MKKNKYFFGLVLAMFFTLYHPKNIEFRVYSNNKLAFKIIPNDIEFYDTTQYRQNIGIHELRLKKDFFKKDTVLLIYPIVIKCMINNAEYFSSTMFHAIQSEPRPWGNFHFRSSCENFWNFPDRMDRRLRKGDTLMLKTTYECNSIEFFHQKKTYEKDIELNLEKKNYRFAHQILYDTTYLNAIKNSNIYIK